MLADGSPVPCILLANKCDSVDAEELEKKKAMLVRARNHELNHVNHQNLELFIPARCKMNLYLRKALLDGTRRQQKKTLTSMRRPRD